MRKVSLSLIVIIMIMFLITGCDGFMPSPPAGGNDEYDQENIELAYLKIIPAQVEMKVNQSKKFEIKAYNSDDKLIKMDISKFEKWVAMYSCVGCGIVWGISPITGSFQTTFTPYKAGRYTISAKYDGEWVQIVVYVD
ncbi:hypothetical protein KO361_05130 [Candidatus Woesearchaeota archaeon]|jgi:hypothetical protein|nr:hypothetical protein [Candidatus Woesearchaeota archaeon]